MSFSRPARFGATVLVFHASLLLGGCLSDKAKSSEPSATCTKAGDPCTFSPGKLGLCIETDSRLLVCQSQH